MAVENVGGRMVEKWSPRPTSQASDGQWWNKKGSEAASAVTADLAALRNTQSPRLRQLTLSSTLYGGKPAFNIANSNQLRLARSTAVPLGRLTFNVIQSAIDALVSKISQDEVVPYFLTSGGSWKQQRMAKKATKFVDGVLYENRSQELTRNALRDACIFGDGVVFGHKKMVDGKKRVCLERCLPTELFVDELEGMYGKPRRMHRVKNVDKKVLAAMPLWSNKPLVRAMILGAQPIPADGAPLGLTNDIVEVRESWHLPSSEGAADGKHLITIAEGELFSEPYKRDWFPFERLTWCDPVAGFWGIGAAAQIQGLQLELNKLLWLQSRAIHLAGAFRVWLKIGSKVVKEQWSNEVGTVGYYAGDVPPADHVVQPVHDQIVMRIERLKQDAYEQLGVSMLSAQSKKPSGLSSGEALREYASIESDRFYSVGKKMQEFTRRLADLSLRLAKEIAEEDGDYEASRPDRRTGSVETISWDELDDFEDDKAVIKCFAVSNLPQEPSAILQTISERVQAGWLNPRQARRLMAFPDLAAADTLADAAEDYIYKVCDKMVDGTSENPEEDFTPPSPEDDLQCAQEVVNEYLQQGKVSGLDDARMDLLRTYRDQVVEMMAATAPAPGGAPGGAPAGASPTGVPAQNPVSDLMPMAGAPTPQ